MTLDPLRGVKNAKIPLVEHQNAENTDVGALTLAVLGYYDNFAIGATILSRSIVTTKRCCIVIVAANININNVPVTRIQRGGVDKGTETVISAVNWGLQNRYAHMLYATEVLDAGNYQYDLVNTSGGVLAIFGSFMKIVAVSAT